MIKEPFTADGVTRKMSELQALTDAELKMETDLMRTHFQSWMQSNFILDQAQDRYLEGMDPVFVRALSADLADCMEFHLPCYITFPRTPIPPMGSKFIQPISELVRVYDPIKGYTVTGQLRIVIDYEE